MKRAMELVLESDSITWDEAMEECEREQEMEAERLEEQEPDCRTCGGVGTGCYCCGNPRSFYL